MSLLLSTNNYNINDVIFLEPTRNKIIKHSYFIKILYSNWLFTMNGLYLHIPIEYEKCMQIGNNKFKYLFNYLKNKSSIDNLYALEQKLLDKINIKKMRRFLCYEQLKNNYIITNKNKKSSEFVIKISGIWETQDAYGLSFKFINN